ncbi:recombinase family protein [Ureibacillus thermosphaericus]|jgi:DNA invertase Pin-like site-specific DNA recombinase|uniref:DNA invertase Pin-like site-specific DNA recombinase n=1 Tax=Ureibacillus thermosphaericus TaxID=51173 RepID=A0A840Q035_URETH|nr:recombinase family protein [Ureibacillus thermosphaericus]MBB5150281.1 DNA invertase Pin-like site-specific DNA recombinase [Ureibacillus thermosphaericus]NKZ32892.1 recombinase family protein [Ureibacillus thermosphaericus]
MIFGYARVSTIDQNLDRQLDKLKEYGVEKIFNEKVTGTRKDRPELSKMMEQLRRGDTVVIESLSRLGRSTKHLIELMENFNELGVNLISLKENIDTTTPTGKLVFNIFASISQFERDLISERTKEGLSSAKARGRKGGRPKKENASIKKAIKLYNSKEYSIKEITEMTGVSKPTLYRYLKEQVNN